MSENLFVFITTFLASVTVPSTYYAFNKYCKDEQITIIKKGEIKDLKEKKRAQISKEDNGKYLRGKNDKLNFKNVKRWEERVGRFVCKSK